jgi:hypothetical protein
MSLNLNNATDAHVADYLFKGMTQVIRNTLKQRLMTELEKDIDQHIHIALSQLKELHLTKDVYADKLNIVIVKQPIEAHHNIK